MHLKLDYILQEIHLELDYIWQENTFDKKWLCEKSRYLCGDASKSPGQSNFLQSLQ